MDLKDLAKLIAILGLLFIGAPVGGMVLSGNRNGQRVIFGLICFMTIGGLLGPAEWGLTLGSVEWYRGHAKGFHFYFDDFFALTLCIALWRGDPKRFRWLPPGLWLYLLYCALSFVSIVNAPKPVYVWMAALKSVEMAILFVAAYNFIQTERDLGFFVTTLAYTMIWEFFVVLKWKYLNHAYQVRGTFEHQNPLAMFTTMVGLIFLSAGMGPGAPRGNLLLFAFISTAGIVQSTLSRAGLIFFAFGAVVVVVVSLLDRPTQRRLLAVGVLGAIGSLGLVLALGTIIARFHDQGNEASGETRDLMNAASRAMYHAHPLGIGWNNFAHTINPPFSYGDVIDDWERERGHKVDPDYAKGVVESHYYLLLAETGVQGLVSYLLLIALFLWWNVRAMFRFRAQFIGCVSLGIFAGCLCNYLQSSLERVLTQPRNLMLWMLLLGTVSRIETWRRESMRPIQS